MQIKRIFMASLTVRQLDERLKKQLRLRAARNGRSVEDEVRIILRDAAEGGGADALAPVAPCHQVEVALTPWRRPPCGACC